MRMLKLQLEDPRRPWLPPLVILIVTLLAFSPLIFGGQFFWDDYDLAISNPAIHASNGLYTIWFTRALPDYFPLTSSLFWIEWRAFGPGVPGGYHLVNVLLHAGTAILLWRVLRALRIPGALLAALLFALHPVNAESPAWIAEGKNTLCLCLAMASLLLWVRSERSGRWPLYVGSLVLFVLALLAKTAVVMLPVALLAILWYRRRLTVPAFLRTLPYFLMSLALGLVTMWFQAHNSIADTQIRTDGFASRLATAGWIVWWHLGKAIFPVNITFAYPTAWWENAVRFGAIAFVPDILIVLVIAALVVLSRRIGRGWAAALIIYVVMLLPTLGFIDIYFMRYSLVSNHWQYPAMPAFCATVGAVVVWLARHGSVRRWNAVMAAALGMLALLAIDTGTIAEVYTTPAGVWNDLLAHDPNSWLAHARLGTMAMDRLQDDPTAVGEAVANWQKVVVERPDLVAGFTNLGNAYIAMGRFKEAEEMYKRGVAAPTGTAQERGILYVDIGALRGKAGDPAGAEQAFEKAVEVDPHLAAGWLRVGFMRAQRGDEEGAREALENAADVDPTFAQPRMDLAQLELRTGHLQAARHWAREAVTAEPDNQQAQEMVAQLDRLAEAPAPAATEPATSRP
jgi:tetratricopeptide (TPR) repeat protein